MVPTTGVGAPEQLLRRLEWSVVRRLDGRLQGDYRTIFRGTGVDFRDLREYEPGDDLRHIDWNVTARTDVPFVRQYTEDRELTAWLLLDRSASMGFGPTDRPKHAVLLELATTLALLLARGGNRVWAAAQPTLTLRSCKSACPTSSRRLAGRDRWACSPEGTMSSQFSSSILVSTTCLMPDSSRWPTQRRASMCWSTREIRSSVLASESWPCSGSASSRLWLPTLASPCIRCRPITRSIQERRTT